MPIWVRVSGLIALVLVGSVVGSMLLGGSSGQTEGDHSAPTGSAAPSRPVAPSHVRPTH